MRKVNFHIISVSMLFLCGHHSSMLRSSQFAVYKVFLATVEITKRE